MNIATLFIRKPLLVLRLLFLIILFLALTHGVLQSRDYRGFEDVYGLLNLFDLDTENNIPSFYSALTLLGASVLLGLIGYMTVKKKGPYIYHWFGLAVVFLFLAIDEAEKIHERLSDPVEAFLSISGEFNSGWVIPFGLALILLLGLYLKFLLALPVRTRNLFLLAGFIFVGGAMGFELLGVSRGSVFGGDLITIVFYTLEEIMEMAGVALFIYALVSYYASLVGGVVESSNRAAVDMH